MAYRVGIRLTIIVCALILSAPVVFAQSQATTGVIEGTVYDEAGAVLPGATVTLLNTGTNFDKVIVTAGDGRFRGVLMPLGGYRITVGLQGYQTQIKEGIQLGVGQTITINFNLSPGAFEDEITVEATTPLIETSRTDNVVGFSTEAVSGLPNDGRNFLRYLNLTPGVGVVQGPDGDEITVNGQKGIQNNVMVDGTDFNNPFFGEQRGGQRPAFTFNVDSVQEMIVVADGAPAEFGRASSGFVTVVTKSGTNAVHGTAHLFYQDDSLRSGQKTLDGDTIDTFPFERVQGGFTLGGPMSKDKLFYFVALDVQQGESTKQNDPERIGQDVVDFMASLGSPNENDPITRTDDNVAAIAKLDWHAGQNHLATFRYTYTDTEQGNGTFDVDSWGVSANAVEKNASWSLGASLVSTIGDNMLNEARLQYAFEDRPRPYDGPELLNTGRPFPDTAFDFLESYRFGMPFFIPVIYDDTRLQVIDNVTWLTKSHTVKAGFDYNHTEAFQTFIGFANGRFIFGSTEGFMNYVANPDYVECDDGSTSPDGNCPDGVDITGPVLLYLQQAGVGDLTVEEAGTQTIDADELALFVQDIWQPRSNLTFSFGLRWEAQYQPDTITPPDEVFFADFIGTTSMGQEFPSDGTIPSDTQMWQPRFGVSWDPKGNGRTVIRANAGVYHARIPGLMLASTRSTNGSRGQSLFRNSELRHILGPPPPYDQLIGPDQVGDPFRPDVYVFDKDFENPETTAVALAVEQKVADRLALVFKYNYNDTKNLTRMINNNDPLLGDGENGPWTTGLGDDGSNGVGVLWTVDSGAKSEYNGVTAGIKGFVHDRVQLQAYYTYSEDKSNDDNERDPFSLRYARITDLDAEWGFSDRDQRDRLNLWMLWSAPGGWNVNASYAYRSAQPLSLTEDGVPAAEPGDRINDDGTITQRNTGRKDNTFSSLDFRVSKTFNLNANLQLEAIVDVFNVFNSANILAPQTTNLIFNFDGTIASGLGDPRAAQLGVRFIW